MIPQNPRWAALVALAMIVPAGLGAAAIAGVLPAPAHLQTAGAEPDSAPIETFTGEVPANVTEGLLRLGVFHGNVLVETWDADAYEIAVYRIGEDGQALGDEQVVVEFAEDLVDGALSLDLDVALRGTAALRYEGSAPEVAVVAKVPDLHWRDALVCSTSEGRGWSLDLGGVFGEEESEGCTSSDVVLRGSIDPRGDRTPESVPFAVRGLRGGALTVVAEYANVALDGASFDEATVHTEYGSVSGTLDAGLLRATTEYGNLELEGTFDNTLLHTEYGSVGLVVVDGGSGHLDLMSEYGDVVLVVPPGRGYDVAAATEYGNLLIGLSNLDDGPRRNASAGGTTADVALPGLLGSGPGPDADARRNGDSFRGKTRDFDAAETQVRIDVVTQYGDVILTDSMKPAANDK